MLNNLRVFIFPGMFVMMFVLSGCNKKNQHHVSGRYIDIVNQKGLAGEKFQIVETVDRGWFNDSRNIVKLTTTDHDGYFDFGMVTLRKGNANKFTVGNATSDWQTDIFKFAAAAPIEFNETENYYDFYIVPAFRQLRIDLENISNSSPGDSISYSMQNEYLKEKNDLDAFKIEGKFRSEEIPYSVNYFKGPVGRYFISIRRKINSVVSYSRDTIVLNKGDFAYQIGL